jgi:hypothetical protein
MGDWMITIVSFWAVAAVVAGRATIKVVSGCNDAPVAATFVRRSDVNSSAAFLPRLKPLMETVCMFVNLWVGAVDDVLVFLHFPGFVAAVLLLTVRRHYRGFDSSILRVLFNMVQI